MLCYNPPISLPINSFSKNFIRISTILHSAILLENFGITPIPALATYLIVTSTTVTIPQPLWLENHTLIYWFMVRNIVLSEYEFQSNSSSNHILIILRMDEPVK